MNFNKNNKNINLVKKYKSSNILSKKRNERMEMREYTNRLKKIMVELSKIKKKNLENYEKISNEMEKNYTEKKNHAEKKNYSEKEKTLLTLEEYLSKFGGLLNRIGNVLDPSEKILSKSVEEHSEEEESLLQFHTLMYERMQHNFAITNNYPGRMNQISNFYNNISSGK